MELAFRGRVMTQIRPDEGRWILRNQGGIVRCFEDLDQAMIGLRDHLIDMITKLDVPS
ncbi:MAG: hypothetical protein ABJE66_29825 [Deltaproteobacteria bacterium]